MSKGFSKYIIAAILLLSFLVLAVTAGYRKDIDIPPDLKGEHVELGKLKLRVYQAGTGPDVLFLHGSIGSVEDFEAIMPKLTSHYRVTAFDRIGHGYSSMGNDLAGVAYNSRITKRLIRKLKLNDVIVVGHSYGGTIALKLAIDENPEIKGYVLLAPAAYGPYKARLIERVMALRGVGLGLLYGVRPFVANGLLRDGLNKSVTPNQDTVPENFFTFRLNLWNNTGILHTRVQQTSFINDELKVMAPHYSAIGRPVTILLGKQEAHANNVRDSHRLSKEIPQARLVQLEGTGHYLQYKQPEAVVDAIDHLGKLP